MEKKIIIGNTSIFVEKALDSFEQILKLEIEIKKERERRASPKAIYDDFEMSFLLGRLVKQKQRELISTIVFSAFALESYINGYGASRFTPALFEIFEKLAIEKKWLLFPFLACNNEIDKTKVGWALLIKLVKSRNWLAHDKPKSFSVDNREEMKWYYEKNEKGIMLSAFEAIQV